MTEATPRMTEAAPRVTEAAPRVTEAAPRVTEAALRPRVAAPPERGQTLRSVRKAVRSVLQGVPGYEEADPKLRKRLAQRMVQVSMAAADLLEEDVKQSHAAVDRAQAQAHPASVADAPVAEAMASIGDTGREGAAVLEATRDAIDFPTFVESLITGVFNAISKSNLTQIQKLVGLLDNVASSTTDFGAQNITDGAAAQWIASKFPKLFKMDSDGSLSMVEDADLSESRKSLANQLEASSGEVDSVQDDELNETLIPLVRRKLSRDRQGMLASMVQMGLQRIVVDEGRLHASMDLRVDTNAVREARKAQRADMRLNTSASAQAGGLGWGAQASMDLSVGYVKSDSEYSKDEIGTQAGLRSSVDLAFRTEQVPLDRLADEKKRVKIKAKAPDPVAVGDGSKGLTSKKSELEKIKLGAIPKQKKEKRVWETNPLKDLKKKAS